MRRGVRPCYAPDSRSRAHVYITVEGTSPKFYQGGSHGTPIDTRSVQRVGAKSPELIAGVDSTDPARTCGPGPALVGNREEPASLPDYLGRFGFFFRTRDGVARYPVNTMTVGEA